jgi:hypothetical protein
MIKVNYPYQDQVITSFVKLAGSVAVPAPDKLPPGVGYIQKQLPHNLQGSVLNSHQLRGKQYYLNRITYYIDGTAVREVDYVSDEIASYQFTDDYVGTVYGDVLQQGTHRFTILATFRSPQNPGVDIYDVLDLNFSYSDNSGGSLLPYLESLTPQQFAGEVDSQIINRMIDYAMTQRTEGALKVDIDGIQTLYDIDNVPKPLIPYLAKTVGYDYFAGLLGNDDTIRDELKFLPQWQKSVGTGESILVLLRALSMDGEINPLYLDLQNNVLRRGVKRRYEHTDTIKVVSQTKRARFTFPLTHASFVDQTIVTNIVGLDDVVHATFVWDIVNNRAAWIYFDTVNQWLVHSNGSNCTLDDVDNVFADRARGGVTIVFKSAVKTTISLNVVVKYQYDYESSPGRNCRLSEFFKVKVMTLAKPNAFPAKDFFHVIDIIKRSKPLRTKLESIDFPFSFADAYVMNPMTVSSTGDLSKTDRLEEWNIAKTEADIRHVITDSVDVRMSKTMTDGFLFSWENCGVDQNRFSIQASLAIEPSLHGEEVRNILANDGLAQRNFALIVNDDSIRKTDAEKRRWLRRLGLKVEQALPCIEATNFLIHNQTIKWDTPRSPAVVWSTPMVCQINDGEVWLSIDLMSDPTNRRGYSVHHTTGSSTFELIDLFDGSTPGDEPFDTSTTNFKTKEFTFSFGTAILAVFRCQDDSDREIIWTGFPELRNYHFENEVWYAAWFLECDFYTNPVHLSTFYASLLTSQQNNCCCIGIGTFSSQGGEPLETSVKAYGDFNAPTFNSVVFNSDDNQDLTYINTGINFNYTVGKTYQFDSTFDFEVYNLYTNEIVAVYRWNGSYWTTILNCIYITAALNPASLSLTSDLIVSGSISYTGAVPTGTPMEWGCRICPTMNGDRFGLDLSQTFTDDFGKAQVHAGMFGVQDTPADFLGVPVGSLFDHVHNQGGIRQAAYDGIYLRNGQLLPCFTMTVTIPSSAAFTWDNVTDNWDDLTKRFDAAGAPNDRVAYHHFPKAVVMEMLAP